MTDLLTEAQLYRRASDLAHIAMGKEDRVSRSHNPEWKSFNDPLAHWLFTESIVSLAQQYAVASLREKTIKGEKP